MNHFHRPALLLAATFALAHPVAAEPAIVAAARLEGQAGATVPDAAVAGQPTYADLAELVLAAPVIADVTIRSTARIKGAEAAGLTPGQDRLYVEADVAALLRGAGGVPPRVGYLVDVPLDARGRAPRLKKARMLVFARPAPGAGGQLQLVARSAQVGWTPAADSTVRRIAAEAVSAAAPPAITGIGNAFHVPGALPGESETQIFLKTADERPVSLSILRRPGEQPRWAVALSEIVDEAAGPPPRDTLLWYRLACGLPRALPAASIADLAPEESRLAAEDYRLVLDRLGPCRSGDVAVAELPAG